MYKYIVLYELTQDDGRGDASGSAKVYCKTMESVKELIKEGKSEGWMDSYKVYQLMEDFQE